MFSDNSLLPKETIRLAALGILSEAPHAYADLANAVRQFVGRIAGPSLELTGPSIEMLRYEGLVETANDDMSKLVIALKMRFMSLLDAAERRDQVDLLIDACELELARLGDLRDPAAGDPFFQDWLTHDIDLVDSRLAWLHALRDRL